MSYTKGPWTSNLMNDITDSTEIPEVDFAYLGQGPESEEEQELIHSNARLIASAPELLEALQYCTTWMEAARASGDSGFWEWSEGDIYSNAMKTIAKALGK